MAISAFALLSLANLKTHLGITGSDDDAVLESAIDRATAMIESHTGRRFMARQWDEWHSVASPSGTLVLRQHPVQYVVGAWSGSATAMTVTSTVTGDISATVAVHPESFGASEAGVSAPTLRLVRVSSAGTTSSSSLSMVTYPTTPQLVTAINAVTGFSATAGVSMRSVQLHPRFGIDLKAVAGVITGANTGMQYTSDTSNGIICMDGTGFESGSDGRVIISYYAGYSTAPHDLAQACATLAAGNYYARKSDPTMASESLGGYSYSRARALDTIADTLDAWKEIR